MACLQRRVSSGESPVVLPHVRRIWGACCAAETWSSTARCSTGRRLAPPSQVGSRFSFPLSFLFLPPSLFLVLLFPFLSCFPYLSFPFCSRPETCAPPARIQPLRPFWMPARPRSWRCSTSACPLRHSPFSLRSPSSSAAVNHRLPDTKPHGCCSWRPPHPVFQDSRHLQSRGARRNPGRCASPQAAAPGTGK